jgi:hypothetical protein
VEIKRVEVVKLGNVVYVMAHGEIRGVKDGGENVGIVDRIIRNNIGGNRNWEDSEMRLNRHNKVWVIE